MIKKIFFHTIFLSVSLFSQGQNSNNQQVWENIDRLELENQIRPALHIVDSLMRATKRTNDCVEYAKSAIYKVKYLPIIYDATTNEIYDTLKTLKHNAPAAALPMLGFWDANLLYNYYMSNKRAIDSKTSDNTAKQYLEEMTKRDFYAAIVSNIDSALWYAQRYPQSLQQLSSFFFASDYYSRFFPELTDQIFHKGVLFFSEMGEGGIEITASYDSDSISRIAFQSFEQQSLKLFERWFNLRVKQSNVAGFIEFEKIKYLYKIDNLPNSNRKYESALLRLIDKYKGNDVAADMEMELAQHYKLMSDNYLASDTETAEFYPYLGMAYKMAKKIVEKYPDSEVSHQAKSLLQSIDSPYLSFFANQKETVGRNFALSLNYSNVQSVKILLFPISGYDFLAYNRTQKNSSDTAIWEQDFQLPASTDFYTHTTNIVIPFCQAGTYLIKILNTQKPEEQPITQVINISSLNVFVHQGGEKEAVYWVVDRFSGEPVKDAEIVLYSRINNYKEVVFTELSKHKVVDGKAIVNTDALAQHSCLSVSTVNDTLWEQLSHYFSNPPKPVSQTRLSLFTDRNIYRPGQTIYLKGIVFSGTAKTYKTESRFPVELIFQDDNYKEIQKFKAVSNEFGSFGLSIPIPENIKPGMLRLSCRYGAVSVRVEEYRRYTFDAEFNDPVHQVLPGEDVEIILAAKTYSGVALNNFAIKGEVLLQSQHFGWMPAKSKVVAVIDTVAAANGMLKFKFKTDKNKHFQTYYIKLAITAESGEIRNYQHTYTVAKAPFYIELSRSKITKNDTLPTFLIRDVNSSNVTEPVSIKILLLEMPKNTTVPTYLQQADKPIYTESEWRNLMPLHEYGNELDKTKMAVNQTIWSFWGNPSDAVLPQNLTKKLQEGVYRVEMEIRGAKSETYLTVVDVNKKTLAFSEIFDLLVSSTTVEAGDKLVCTFITSVEKANIWYGITANNNTLEQKNVMLKKGKCQIHIPITEDYEGSVFINACLPYGGQIENKHVEIKVLRKSKQLKIETLSLRNLLLPKMQEDWSFKISGYGKQSANAELLASMYDASLDTFEPDRKWNIAVNYPIYNTTTLWTPYVIPIIASQEKHYYYQQQPAVFDWTFWGQTGLTGSGSKSRGLAGADIPVMFKSNTTMLSDNSEDVFMSTEQSTLLAAQSFKINAADKSQTAFMQLRTNMKETAFFYPSLQNDSTGMVNVKFQVPDALTTWRLRLLGHDNNLASGYFETTVQTQKPLMVIPVFPRFAYTDDSLTINATVFNQTDSVLSITPNAEVTDITTAANRSIQIIPNTLTIAPKSEKVFIITLKTPANPALLQTRVTATAGDFTDGEENTFPVHPDRQYVTNTLALWGKPSGNTLYKFDNMEPTNHDADNQHQLTLEISTNPVWYAVQALPTFDNPDENSPLAVSEAIFATAMGNNIVGQFSDISKAIEIWQQHQPDALQSQLSENSELKLARIEQTPWYNNALSGEMQLKNLAIFLDQNNLLYKLEQYIEMLLKLQHSSGGFCWRTGFQPSSFITTQVTEQICRLIDTNRDVLNKYPNLLSIAQNGLDFLKKQVEKEYKLLLNSKSDTSKAVTPYHIVQYFYIQALLDKNYQPAADAETFYMKHASANISKYNLYGRATMGIVLQKTGSVKAATAVLKGFEGSAVVHVEKGVFWRENTGGWEWYQSTVKTHTRIMEFYSEMQAATNRIEAMKIFLLQQKRTKTWHNNASTIDAIYTLLSTGRQWINNSNPVTLMLSGLKIVSSDYEQTYGTGYFKTVMTSNQIPKSFTSVSIDNPNSNPVYGGVYSQFYEDFENIKPSQTNLTINDEYFELTAGEEQMELKQISSEKNGKKRIEPNFASTVRVRLTITSDRELDYVVVKFPFAACFEQADQISGYKNGQYQQNFDDKTEFYVQRLKQGVTVLELDLKTLRTGVYKSAPLQVQSLYAPEFAAHSKGACVVSF